MYAKVDILGEGSFGVVYRVRHVATNRTFAMKKLYMERSREGLRISAVDEITALQEIQHPNVIRLHDVVLKESGCTCLVLDYMQVELLHYINAKNPARPTFMPLEWADVKYFTEMLVEGVKEIHQRGFLHRDIKPNNLLIDELGVLKIADFGSARRFVGDEQKFSPSAITNLYRPPELLLGCGTYGRESDMWSVGCVVAEMLLRRTIFSGQSDLGVLGSIIDKLGSPPCQVYAELFAEQGGLMIQFAEVAACPWQEILPAAPPAAIELVASLLQLDPRRRATPEAVLAMQWKGSDPPPPDRAVIAERVRLLADHRRRHVTPMLSLPPDCPRSPMQEAITRELMEAPAGPE